MTRVPLTALALTLLAGSAYAACTDKRAIWEWPFEGGRHVVFGTEGIHYGSEIYFEEWRGDRLAWRGGGSITCSNGASTCYGLIRNNLGDDGITEAVLENIDADQDGIADWVIFAGLSEALWYNEGLKVQWFNGFGPEGVSDRIQAPNIYKLAGCRATDDVKLADR